MKTKIIVGFLFLITLVFSFGVYMYFKPSEKVVLAEALYEVNAESIYREFSDNETEANKKYLNKVITVEGKVSEMLTIDSTGLNVTLSSDNPLFGVSCQLPMETIKTKLKIGDDVRIKGLCTGKLMDVVLVRCVIEDYKN